MCTAELVPSCSVIPKATGPYSVQGTTLWHCGTGWVFGGTCEAEALSPPLLELPISTWCHLPTCRSFPSLLFFPTLSPSHPLQNKTIPFSILQLPFATSQLLLDNLNILDSSSPIYNHFTTLTAVVSPSPAIPLSLPPVLATQFKPTITIMPGKKIRCSAKECKEAAQRIVGDCTFCKGHFCGKHRLLEDHKCSGLEDVS